MYRYETHLHTSPVSKCAKKTIGESLSFYASLGYDGVFLTNHFLDGNFYLRDADLPYTEKINLYCKDYEDGLPIAKKLGIKLFFGVEITYGGTDFLIYGLDKEWYLAHPEIMEMRKSAELDFLREQGALVIQAHPFRDSTYIDHIRLFPRCVDGVEVINSSRPAFENEMAKLYADKYGFVCQTAGSDNHRAGECPQLAGMECETPLESVADYIARVRAGSMRIFTIDRTKETAQK